MPVMAQNYEVITEARDLGRWHFRSWKKTVVLVGAGGTLALLLAAVRPHLPRNSPVIETDSRQTLWAENEFQKKCMFIMRTTGCDKKSDPKHNVYWSCEENDWTIQYKCCCMSQQNWPHAQLQQLGILKPTSTPQWQQQSQQQGNSFAAGVSSIIQQGENALLQFMQHTSMCLKGPEDALGGHFTTWDCEDGQMGTRFQLPPRGAGTIRWSKKPGMCLGLVNEGSKEVKAVPCQPGNMNQMFQLTEGSHGMIQWSHSGNLCLDVEDDEISQGKTIVLNNCVYWPKKASQQFKMTKAPPIKKKKEKKKSKDDEDDEDEDEDDEDEDEDEDEKEVSDKEEEEEEKKPKVSPSLFCVSLMLPWTYEKQMLKSHAKKGVGIFACDDYAVYSSKRIKLRGGHHPFYSDLMNGTLKAKMGGEFHTALNTPIFRRFWKRVIVDKKAWTNDWVAKVDPDAVFFPDRLKIILKNRWHNGLPRPNKAVWLQNCQLGLHGPLEVFTKQALGVYNKRQSECDEEAEEIGQEDKFLGHCLKKLQIEQVNAYNILLEWAWACNERPSSSHRQALPPCYDKQVSFHPFKTVKTYWQCFHKANSTIFPKTTYINGMEPSASNHHHA